MCQTACTSADFSFHGLIQHKNRFAFLLPPFYFATVFRHFISPLYSAFLFRPSFFALLFNFAILFSPFYLISPFFFAIYFISPFFFAPLFYFALLFRPSILFHHSFHPSILSFYLYFQMQTCFRISISGLHSNIFSHTRMNTTTLHTFHNSRNLKSNTAYDSRLTTHTTHDSRNLESNTAYDSRLIRLTTHTTHDSRNQKSNTAYDSRLTSLVLISPVNFALLFSPFYFVSYLNCQIYTRFHLSISFVSKFFFIYKPFCFSPL